MSGSLFCFARTEEHTMKRKKVIILSQTILQAAALNVRMDPLVPACANEENAHFP